MTRTAAVIGAGVIGSGWVVRFVANGWHVRIYDTDPGAQARLTQTLRRARPHVQALHKTADFSGTFEVVDELTHCVDDADWIQECLPEDLTLKRTVCERLPETSKLVASSTSGMKPSVLAAGHVWADRFMVCHPFNPVYLLPLVEVVPHALCTEPCIDYAMSTLNSLGMRPLHVRHEIDGHIADRLLEAVWREALWLVHDGIATTAEIDDAIKYGFGLRWAQMGLFETYRLGGGGAGMRQFLQQFGPALQWPWSKLTDVPELSEDLIDTLVAQSDAQSGGESIDAMAARRDRNLVAIMQALAAAEKD